jgi:SAM-dependent methyltransferase
MGAFSVVVVEPPGYPHSAAFAEVAQLLLHGLARLGHDAVLAAAPAPGRRPIVLGANLLPSYPLPLPPDAILYNLEQLDPGSPWITPELVAVLRRHAVWDYSARNAAQYAALGLPRPQVLPVGWTPELERIAPAAEDVDVLFYGSVNPRRRAILDALRARGLRVETLFGVYGAERDRWIARSKLVLNVHFYDARVFEVVRVSYLLGNRRCVVSERGADAAEEAEYEAGVVFAPYDALVDTCVRLAGDPAARERLAAAGQAVIRRRDEAAYLRAALDGVPARAPAPAAAPNAAVEAAPDPAPDAAPPPGSGQPGYYDWARPEVVEAARPAGKRVLDVGCAAGAMGAAMLAAGAAEVAGVEVVAGAAARARTRLTAVYQLDAEALPELPYPDGYFDVMTFADVLEHLRDPAAVLRHLRRWLADDGRIVCSIPNVRHASVLVPLLVEGRFDYADAGILDRTHLRFFTVDGMVKLLAAAGFAPDGPATKVTGPASPAVPRIAELVATLGGDARRFEEEARIVQVVVGARPTERRGVAAEGLLDPWRGSRPVKMLLTPDLGDASDAWARILGELVDGLGANERVTVGLALPLAELSDPPAALKAVADRSSVDLLVTEAPADPAGWERLLAGASVWVATSPRPELAALAARVGVEVQRASPAR